MKMFRNVVCCALYLLVLLITQGNTVTNRKLPSFLKTCRRSDLHLTDCIKNSVELLRPLIAKGIPEFGIPSCEPLYIPEVIMDQGSGAVAVKSTYTDIKVYGPSEFVLKSVRIDLDRNRVKIRLFLPRLTLTCHYNMDGRILMMPITGSGTSHGNYSNIDAVVSIHGERVKKDDESYFNVRDFFVDFNIGHASVQLDDLFNGDKELGEAMNVFLNDNWKNVANEIKPVLEDTIATIFKKFANKIFHKYPLDLLLPP